MKSFLLNKSVFFLLQIILCCVGFAENSIPFFKSAVFLILLYCIFQGSEQKYVINPYYLLILTPISLLIYYNIGDAYLVDLTRDTWLLIVCNVNSLLAGLSYTSPTKFREKYFNKIQPLRLYANTAWIFTFLGIIPPIVFRFTGVTLPLAYIIQMLGAAGVMSAMATKKKWLGIVIIALYVFPITLGGASKSGVLTLLLALIISYEKFYVDRDSATDYRRSRRKLICGYLLAIPIMIGSFSFANKERGFYDADEGLTYYEDQIEWKYDSSYFMPYMYIVTPWANLQYVLETQDNRSNGYWFTKPVLGVFDGDEPLKQDYILHAYSSFNTFSFIGLHFKDFGYWGSLLVSLFLGWFIKKIYSQYAQSPSPYNAAAYVFTAQATLELFFSNHFFGQSYPFMIVFVMYLFKKIMRI